MSIIEGVMRHVQSAQQSNAKPEDETQVPLQPAVTPVWHKLVVVGAVCFVLGAVTAKALLVPVKIASLPVKQAQNLVAPVSVVMPVNSSSRPAVAVNPGKEDEGRREVVAAVDAWVKAWSDKDMDNYLSAYAPEFHPPEGLSRSEWEKQRRKRINKYGKIEIKLSDLVVISQKDAAIVEFVQSFKTDVFSETGLHKRLELRRQGSRWVIVNEVSYKG